jgi:NAD(P)-dependent dehydrogenase (short-subunit alcohol dehydrogenase family)
VESDRLVAPEDRPLFSLRGRTAIVTGAAGLLGREHCLALGKAGANVVATDLDAQALEGAARELEERDIHTLSLPADITDRGTLEALRDAALARFGAIDVLVHSAAIDDKFDPQADVAATRFEVYPLERWRRSLDVNVTGAFLSCQVFGSEMARRGRGSIINIASTYGMVAPDPSLYEDANGRRRFLKSPAYPTGKGAVLALSRYLAAYWGPAGVRVNSLSPGGVEAGQDVEFVARYGRRTPLGRMARRDEYHGAVVFLASDASSYVTGSNLVVDGGWTSW